MCRNKLILHMKRKEKRIHKQINGLIFFFFCLEFRNREKICLRDISRCDCIIFEVNPNQYEKRMRSSVGKRNIVLSVGGT
jgi:hypothetical protein